MMKEDYEESIISFKGAKLPLKLSELFKNDL